MGSGLCRQRLAALGLAALVWARRSYGEWGTKPSTMKMGSGVSCKWLNGEWGMLMKTVWGVGYGTERPMGGGVHDLRSWGLGVPTPPVQVNFGTAIRSPRWGLSGGSEAASPYMKTTF